MGDLAGPAAIAFLIYFVILVGKLTVNVLNAYGGFMSILTTVTAFNGQSRISSTARTLYILGFTAVSVLIAIAASADFLDNFKNFVLVLLMVFTPWSAINLIDYYLISKERIDIPALYDVNGRYGAWNFTALACYAAAFSPRSRSSPRRCTPAPSRTCSAAPTSRGWSASCSPG